MGLDRFSLYVATFMRWAAYLDDCVRRWNVDGEICSFGRRRHRAAPAGFRERAAGDRRSRKQAQVTGSNLAAVHTTVTLYRSLLGRGAHPSATERRFGCGCGHGRRLSATSTPMVVPVPRTASVRFPVRREAWTLVRPRICRPSQGRNARQTSTLRSLPSSPDLQARSVPQCDSVVAARITRRLETHTFQFAQGLCRTAAAQGTNAGDNQSAVGHRLWPQKLVAPFSKRGKSPFVCSREPAVRNPTGTWRGKLSMAVGERNGEGSNARLTVPQHSFVPSE